MRQIMLRLLLLFAAAAEFAPAGTEEIVTRKEKP